MKLSVASFLFATAVVVSLPVAARAQVYNADFPECGPYFRAGAGAAFTQDGHFREFDGVPVGNKINYRTGLAIDAAGGYQFNRYFGMDVEVGWIVNEISDAEGFASSDTFVHNIPILANAILQFPIPNTFITPYAGAGAGGAITVFDTDGFSNGGVTLSGNDSDVVFAYQFFGGIRFNINPQMSVGVEYKYFATDNSRYRYPDFFGIEPDLVFGLSGVRSHVVTATVNIKF